MDFLEQIAADLIRDEGLRLRPYRDTEGKLTVGVGHNLDDLGISEPVAMLMLREDVADAEGMLDDNLPWWRTLDEERQLALLNMAFNMGPRRGREKGERRGLLGFTNSLRLIQDHRWEEAAIHLRESKWYRQVGPRARRVIERIRTGKRESDDVA